MCRGSAAGADSPQHLLFILTVHTSPFEQALGIFFYCEEAQASLCKYADSPDPLLQAHDILILIALSSDYVCANVHSPESMLLVE